jgi:hypothetical protein
MPYLRREFTVRPAPGTEEIACDVCRFGIEDDRTEASEQSVFNYTTTGTVWNDRDISKIDVEVKSHIPAGLNCPFCGSNRYKDGGKRGSL